MSKLLYPLLTASPALPLAQGVIAMLAGILAAVLTVLVAYGLRKVAIRDMHPRGVSLLAKPARAFVFLLALAACVITARLVYRFVSAGSIRQVCAGQASPVAAPYEGSSIHPMVFVMYGEPHKWDSWIPVEWLADNPNDTQLVGCLDQQWVAIETCRYVGGPNITRYRGDLTVRLVQARTGTLVAAHTFQGPDPRECAPRAPVDLTSIYGDVDASFSEVKAWLLQHVQASD